MLTNEEWRDIKDYEGKYKVSENGLVINVKTGKILKNKLTKDGYYETALCNMGKIKYIRTHRIVLSAFVRTPKKGEQANHIDCNRLNNNFKNLEWVTPMENTKHRKRYGKLNSGVANGNRKIKPKDEERIEIMKLAKMTKKSISIEFNCHKKTIQGRELC